MLFQNFSRSHVIRPGRFLFLQHDTYETTNRPGLTLDGKLSAVYQPAGIKLLFHNFRTVNTFLPLADFYKEASEQEIREVLSHELAGAGGPECAGNRSNQWFRKRFAMLQGFGRAGPVLREEIQERSDGYKVDVQVTQGKIVFPADKPAAKKLLQFLNEEFFRGAITETLYETNSKREAD